VGKVRRLCPAKVNLSLRVLGRRKDGYHELVTVMQPLSLADELILGFETVGAGITLEGDLAGTPVGEGNLVWRAARLFQAETGRGESIRLTLNKRIPVAAGLGGGSSDAAGVLAALNILAGKPLQEAELHRLAVRLGADVPFFLLRGPAVARGIGADLTPISLPPIWYLLVNPGLRLSTRWVYQNLDLEALGRRPGRPDDFRDPADPENWGDNDLADVTLKHYPQLVELLQTLAGLGGQAHGMSGSGPTLFAVFSSAEAAQDAARRLRRTFPGWLAVVRGLTGDAPETQWESHVWMI